MKHHACLSAAAVCLLLAAGLVSAQSSPPPADGSNVLTADPVHRSITVTGTVASVRDGSLVVRIDDHHHRIPFSLAPGVSVDGLRAGNRVSVRYHPSGSTGQVADAIEVLARRSGARR